MGFRGVLAAHRPVLVDYRVILVAILVLFSEVYRIVYRAVLVLLFTSPGELKTGTCGPKIISAGL